MSKYKLARSQFGGMGGKAKFANPKRKKFATGQNFKIDQNLCFGVITFKTTKNGFWTMPMLHTKYPTFNSLFGC